MILGESMKFILNYIKSSSQLRLIKLTYSDFRFRFAGAIIISFYNIFLNLDSLDHNQFLDLDLFELLETIL